MGFTVTSAVGHLGNGSFDCNAPNENNTISSNVNSVSAVWRLPVPLRYRLSQVLEKIGFKRLGKTQLASSIKPRLCQSPNCLSRRMRSKGWILCRKIASELRRERGFFVVAADVGGDAGFIDYRLLQCVHVHLILQAQFLDQLHGVVPQPRIHPVGIVMHLDVKPVSAPSELDRLVYEISRRSYPHHVKEH